MAISNLVALFIVITTAATLNAHGVTQSQLPHKPPKRYGRWPGR